MKKFEWLIDEDENIHGVKAISLVDQPAMESEFIAFKKQEKPIKFVRVNLEEKEYEQRVMGLAMIPDKEIYRVDPQTGEEYVGYFSASTIKKIQEKFHKEQQDQNVNTDHEEDEVVEAFLVEDYILNSELQVEDLKAKGIEEAVLGAWVTTYKIEDKEVFEKVLDGEYNGFSVELYANRILESFNNNTHKKLFSMKNLLSKIKEVIQEFEVTENKTDEVKLIDAMIPEAEITVRQESEGWVVDAEIYQVQVNEEGEEVLEPAPDGEHVLEDGTTLVVAEGILIEIREPDAEEEAPAEEPVEEELKDISSTEDVEAAEEAEGEESSGGDTKKSLEELIDMSKDGYYTVEVMVENGAFTYGAIYANTWKELEFKAENFDKIKSEKEELAKEVEELKAKIKEPIADPKLGFDGDEVVEDYKPKNNFERIAIKNGLPLV